MKYIITESQLKSLVEDHALWFRRRANESMMRDFIDKAIDNTNPCEFDGPYDYADNIIHWACTDVLSIDEDFYNSKEFDDFHQILRDMCKEWFYQELLDNYKNSCGNSINYFG